MDVWSHDRADHKGTRLKRLDGVKGKKQGHRCVRGVTGNLRFPLDKTYHGRPYLFYLFRMGIIIFRR